MSVLRPTWRWLPPLCALVLSPVAQAQLINDPTRPPPGIDAPAADSAAASGPVLQSIKISATERSAMIGGQTVKLGAKYGDARVIKITESEVVLRTTTGNETLRMYPNVDIKPVAPAASADKRPAKKKRGSAANTRRKD